MYGKLHDLPTFSHRPGTTTSFKPFLIHSVDILREAQAAIDAIEL